MTTKTWFACPFRCSKTLRKTKYILNVIWYCRGEFFHQKLKLFRDAPKFSKLFQYKKLCKWVKFVDTFVKNSCFLCFWAFFDKIQELLKNYFIQKSKLFRKWVKFFKLFRDDYLQITRNIHPCILVWQFSNRVKNNKSMTCHFLKKIYAFLAKLSNFKNEKSNS